MKTFSLLEKSKILLYGAGVLGRFYYYRIREVFNVVAFLDKNAHKIEQINEVFVYTPEDYVLEHTKLDIPVFLCVHNGQAHIDIARKLYHYGYSNIIFMPLYNFDNSCAIKQMKTAYNAIIEEQYESLVNIPSYCNFMENRNIEKVIRRNEKYVVFSISFELLYSGRQLLEHELNSVEKDFLNNCDIPLIAHKAYRELFSYFLTGKGTADYYLHLYLKIQNEDFNGTQFLKNRYDVYKMLEMEYQKGAEEYIYSPIEAVWNKRGYFNIVDGHHRAMYLYLQNVKKVPIRVVSDDYEKYCNFAKSKEIQEYLHINNVEKVYTPIPYFNLFDIPSERECVGKTVLGCIQVYLRGVKLGSVIDLSIYNSYFARNCYRMKATKVTSVEIDLQKYEVAKLLNDLLHISSMNLVLKEDRFCLEENYDIAFVMGSFEIQRGKEIAAYLNNHISKMVIWESGSQPQLEKQIIMEESKFNKYTFLDNFYTGQYCSEVGVFSIGEGND